MTPDDRDRTWSELFAKARALTDRDGTLLDEKVAETVVGLWTHRVETITTFGNMSPWPFVWVSSLSDEEISVLGKAAPPVDLDPPLRERIRRVLVAQERVIALLDAFYADRRMSTEVMLVTANVQEVPGFYLRSQGAPVMSLRDGADRDRLLHGLRSEMAAFGEFLHKRFLSGSGPGISPNTEPCFFGRFPRRVDDERRFALPDDWISELALARHDLRLVVLPTLIGEAVSLVTAQSFERIRFPVEEDGHGWWLVTPDRDGRVTLPTDVAERLGREITALGVDDRIELWPSERLRLESSPSRA